MGSRSWESRPALERGTPRPRNTKDRPVGGLHVPADRGEREDQTFSDVDPPRQAALSSSRKRRFSTTAELCRMCAAPLWRAFQPEGKAVPAVQSVAASIAAFPSPRRPTSQPSLPLTLPRMRAGRPRLRGLSSSFLPADGGSPYRLPREASERLALALTPARNREAAFALARFLARFWSTPSRLLTAFPIDRRALANRPDLGLTEAQVRGAVR